MSHVTDRKHLLSVAESGIEAIETLARAWLAEDQAACAPRSGGLDGPVSGGGTSNPTGEIATGRDPGPDGDGDPTVRPVDADKYRDRDRLGSRLLTLVGQLKAAAADLEPVMPSRSCTCCGSVTATHGRDDRGVPAECWACWQYRRKMGFRCDEEIHRGRPDGRMCECGPDCCDVCPDRPAEGRTVSERCKKRIQRSPRVA